MPKPAPSILGVLILGVVQGLTEFLPISSSGHLVVGGYLLGVNKEQPLLLDVLLHLGTLVPVVVLYWQDLLEILAALPRVLRLPPAKLWRQDRGFRLAICVLIGTLPTGVIGLLLEKTFEALFGSLTAVGCTFIITGVILMASRLRRPPPALREMPEAAASHLTLTAARALCVGLAQSVAITPGISRSGTTITAGLLLGVERVMAARFSFLLSIPAISGAVLLHLRKAEAVPASTLVIYAAGALAAAASGYLALRWLVRLVRRGELHWFSFYLWPLGLIVLGYSLLN